MTTYNPAIHHRRSIRLKGYDYAQEGLYFITICCKDRLHLFGEIKNGKMILNEFGEIAEEEWKNTELVRDNCKIHSFVIMPNHIHGVIEITKNKGNIEAIGKFQSPSQTVGSIVRGFKISVIKKIKNRLGVITENKEGKVERSVEKVERRERSVESWGELQFAPTLDPKFAPTLDPLDPINAPTLDPLDPINEPISKKILELNFKIWQRDYFEKIIRNDLAFERISNYIIENPKNWKEDKFYL